jgi:hypothetical protein
VIGADGARPFQLDIFEELNGKNSKKPVFRFCRLNLVDCANPKKLETATSIIDTVKSNERELDRTVKQSSYQILLDDILYRRAIKNGKKGAIVVEIDV